MQVPGLYTLETVRNHYVSSQLINSKQMTSCTNSMIKQVIKRIHRYQIMKLGLNELEDE
jgi:outer membrane receptor for Fe3+-dicitrate